jgi:putative ABC transport system permease protein
MKKLIDGSLNKKKLIQEQGVIYIQANNSKSSVQVGDEVYVRLQTNDTDRLSDVKKVKISGIVKLNQFENKIMAYPEVLSFINNQKVNRISLFLNSNNNEKKVEKRLNKLAVQYPNIDIINELKIQRNLSSLYLQIQILLYGFLIVIGFIAVLNIFNTTFMNIILRKSEYATLQAIGMSIKSIRRMITTEGVLYGIISVMIGSTVAKVAEILLFLSSGNPQGTGHLKLYITSWFGILIICYISARVSSRILKKIQWKDTLRNE